MKLLNLSEKDSMNMNNYKGHAKDFTESKYKKLLLN